MAKAKLYKANLNWMVVGENGEKIMGATPEMATEAFTALWATHYPGIPVPEIERDETLDINTAPKDPVEPLSPAEAPAPEVKPATAPAEAKFSMDQLHEALVKGEKHQKLYAPAFAHPLLAPNVEVTYEAALEAVRSLERGLSATTGQQVVLL